MSPRRWLAFLFLFVLALPAHAQELQSPEAFLGYVPGERFTPHHRVIDYVQHVAAVSPRAKLHRYGTTYEGRPLVVLYVSSPESMARLEQIRTDNLRRAGMLPGEPTGPPRTIVWLSYNVHGDEASSTEAAMNVLYALADPTSQRTGRWLEDAVVILDPCVNPDGRQRYVHWYQQVSGSAPNANPDAREHHQPWPGGRTNHYYFDLNRDWAWGVQRATRQRLKLYNRWLPHVHVDFHEMGVNDPYYFAPAAEPVHPLITDFQRAFQVTIGKNNAAAFDEEGWLYFTREVYDLFYPGYGDTWPLLNGAIGMTYEQGGGGGAGLGIRTAAGDTLTLEDRVAHHYTTSMTTVKTAARHAERLVAESAAYYEAAQNDPPGPYAAYVVKNGNRDKVEALADHLDEQGIRYAYAAEAQDARGFHYATEETEDVQIEPRDMIVPIAQPKAHLAKVLFGPNPLPSDSVTYDITAWALPYAYGLDAYALTERVGVRTTSAMPARSEVAAPSAATESPYAFLAEWKSLADARLLAALLKEGIEVRFAQKPFETEFSVEGGQMGGRHWGRGTLVITRADNEELGDRFGRVVRRVAERTGQPVWPVETGLVPGGGPDFGSGNVVYLEKPRVVILAGEPLSPYAVGEVWHFFDRQLGYPATLVYPETFDMADLAAYDVLVLPDGRYDEVFSEANLAALKDWIRRGGRLVAMESAVGFLAGEKGFAIERKEAVEADTAATELRTYARRERVAASENVPGAIFRARLDNTHPLAYGYGGTYFTLKVGSEAYAYLDEGWTVAALREEAHVRGFAGAEARTQLENTLAFGVQPMGDGAVVYLVDNPLFRGFWQGGKLLFANAIFLVGQG